MQGSWDEVGDGVFRRRYERLDQNVCLIVTGEGLVVVDSRSTHADADELRADIAALSSLPVRYLVNTHHHWDHTFGNARFPEAVIVGHVRCRETLIDDGERVKADLAAADWVPEEQRPAFLAVEITPPQVVFTDAMTVHLGNRAVVLRHLGRGHTDNDIVASVDDVLLAGDLVEEGAPPSFGDAFPRSWVDTLGRVLELAGGPVIPGHGDVVDREFVEEQRDEMAEAIAHDGDPAAGPYPEATMRTVQERLALEDG